jgi:restriction endonuclease S subunit
MAEHYVVPDELTEGTPLDGTVWQFGRLDPMPPAVPRGWRLVRLTTVARLESGHTPSRREPSWWGGNVPWVSLGDTDRLDGPVITQTSENINEHGLANSSARVLPAGTVVVSRTATVGKVTILGHDMATSQDFANYVCGPEVHNVYLMQLLRFMQPEWRRLRAGSTHNTVYMPVFKSLQVLLPPLDEQRRIAAVLSAIDAAVARENALLSRLRESKRAVASHLFASEAPAWTTIALGDAGRWLSGGTPSKANTNLWSGPVPWVSPKDMKRARIGDAIDHVAEAALGAGTQLAPIDSILMVVRGMILAHTFPVALAVREVAFNQDIKVLVPRADLDSEFLLYWFEAHALDFLGQVDVANHGTKRLPTESIFAMRLPVPPRDEQRRIAAVLASFDAAQERTRDTVAATTQLKNATAHRLLGAPT